MKVLTILFVVIFVGGCLSASLFNNEKFKGLKTNLHSRAHTPKKAYEEPKKLLNERKFGTNEHDFDDDENNHQGADKGKRCPSRNDMQAAILESTHNNPRKIVLARRETHTGNKRMCNFCRESTKCKKHNKCESCEKYCTFEDTLKEENNQKKAQVSPNEAVSVSVTEKTSTNINDASVSSTNNNINDNFSLNNINLKTEPTSAVLSAAAPLLESRFSETEDNENTNSEFNTLTKVGSLNSSTFLFYGIVEYFQIRSKEVEELVIFVKPKSENSGLSQQIGRNAQNHNLVDNGITNNRIEELEASKEHSNDGEVGEILHIPVINNFLPESGSHHKVEELSENIDDNVNNHQTGENIFNVDGNFQTHQLNGIDLNNLHQNVGENGNLQTDFVHQNNLQTDLAADQQNLHQNADDEQKTTKVDTHSSESNESEDNKDKFEEHNKSIDSKESVESKESKLNINPLQSTINLIPNTPNFNDVNNDFVVNQRLSNINENTNNNDKNSESKESDEDSKIQNQTQTVDKKDSNESSESDENENTNINTTINPPSINEKMINSPKNIVNNDLFSTNSFENTISSSNTPPKLNQNGDDNETKKLVDVFTEIIKNDLRGEENLAEIENENIHQAVTDLVSKTVNREEKVSDAIHQSLNKLEDTIETNTNIEGNENIGNADVNEETLLSDAQENLNTPNKVGENNVSESPPNEVSDINTEHVRDIDNKNAAIESVLTENANINEGQNEFPPKTIKKDLQKEPQEDSVEKSTHISDNSESMEKTDTKINVEGIHDSLKSDGQNYSPLNIDGVDKTSPENGGEQNSLLEQISGKENLNPVAEIEGNSVLEPNLQKIRANEHENIPPAAVAEKALSEINLRDETNKTPLLNADVQNSQLNSDSGKDNQTNTESRLSSTKLLANELLEAPKAQNDQDDIADVNINVNNDFINKDYSNNIQQNPVLQTDFVEEPQNEAITPKMPIKNKLQSTPTAKFVENENINKADAAYMDKKIKIYENSPDLNVQNAQQNDQINSENTASVLNSENEFSTIKPHVNNDGFENPLLKTDLSEEPQNEAITPKMPIKKKLQSAPRAKFVENENINKADAAYMDKKIKIYENSPDLNVQNAQQNDQINSVNTASVISTEKTLENEFSTMKPHVNDDEFEELQEKLEHRNSQNITDKEDIDVISNSEKENIANTVNGEQLNPPQQIVGENITSKPQQNVDDEKTPTNSDANVKPNNEEVGCNLEEKLNPLEDYSAQTIEKHRLLNDGQINRLIQPLYGLLHAKDNAVNKIKPNKILHTIKSDMEKALPYIDDNSNYLPASEQNYLKDTPQMYGNKEISPDLNTRGEFSDTKSLDTLYRSSDGVSNGKNPSNKILGSNIDWAYEGNDEKSPNTNNRLDYFGKLVFAHDRSTITNYDNKEMDKQAYFIGNGIKLPLIMKPDKDGSLQLTVDIEKLCNCKEKVCNKNLIENGEQNNIEETLINDVKSSLMEARNSESNTKNSGANKDVNEKLEAALEKEMFLNAEEEKAERKRRQLILKPSPIYLSNDIAIGYKTNTNEPNEDSEEDEIIQKTPFKSNFKGYKNGHEKDNVIVQYSNNNDEGFVQRRLGLVKKVLSWMKNIAVQGDEIDN